MRVRQSRCGTCGRPVGVGRAIVKEFGAGGRYHAECPPQRTGRPLEAPTTHERVSGRPGSQGGVTGQYSGQGKGA